MNMKGIYFIIVMVIKCSTGSTIEDLNLLMNTSAWQYVMDNTVDDICEGTTTTFELFQKAMNTSDNEDKINYAFQVGQHEIMSRVYKYAYFQTYYSIEAFQKIADKEYILQTLLEGLILMKYFLKKLKIRSHKEFGNFINYLKSSYEDDVMNILQNMLNHFLETILPSINLENNNIWCCSNIFQMSRTSNYNSRCIEIYEIIRSTLNGFPNYSTEDQTYAFDKIFYNNFTEPDLIYGIQQIHGLICYEFKIE
ncbi:uncharacterized protein LOC126897875 [Daktulosphaira vitifoliae]|uniref:uncharacterized protein LOC126897875 n=1 Tax=Daktulosphaira vitifoliae TaxID=58002 RepID=UPI0021A9E82E|nr:uncharacterized protein LOC126897875 [Daktulosphaira vitifoliae]